jgi:arylsulfatase A-like enzyme
MTNHKSWLALIVCSASLFGFTDCTAADRPNVVWIVSEDNSIHYMDLFFKGGAKTPHIAALAKDGLVFRNAFSNSPVCSVARTTLATGCYGPRIGTQYHRKYKQSVLHGQRLFSTYLRDAGYYTSNNSKTDYNATPSKDAWDESSNRATWRKRPDKSQPFFHMQSHANSHESSLHFRRNVFENEKTRHDPSKIELADYFPDTPLFRFTHAYYLDRMQVIDDIVGDTVARLTEDGLLEDTFIFYFGDHGGVLPRGKGYIYESGLHVPLVVRVPENFKRLVGLDRGSSVDGFVSFIDFGPTVLNLAGVKVPQPMDGVPFLGAGVSMADVNKQDTAFGYADRFDEKYDLLRSLRKGKYQYIRCYQPFLPDGLQNNYRYRMLAYQQWRELSKAGKLNAAQQQFFAAKPVELLYDTAADPHEVNNLAGSAGHQDILVSLRTELNRKMKAMPDLSFYPESHLVAHALDDAVAFGQKHKSDIAAMIDTADLAVKPFHEAKRGIKAALNSDEPMQRYWGAMVCSSFGDQAAEFVSTVDKLADGDKSAVVRIRAAEFLGLIGSRDPQPILADVINTTSSGVVATEALNSVTYFTDFTKYKVNMKSIKPVAKGDGVNRRIDYLNGEPYKSKPLKGNRRKRKSA